MNNLFKRLNGSETKSLTWFGNYEHLIDLDAGNLPDNMILLNKEHEFVGVMGTNYKSSKIHVILPFSHILPVLKKHKKKRNKEV
ncbi:hypothetical protein M0R04_11575 [Candidatus Dojkabacteria bacterium]|jgi:hypothetical protein|nr:hypothetical protein [Candidatus Dojkabacteria bacterium]